MQQKLGFLALLMIAQWSMAAPLPWDAPDKHLGVATCAGSNCHGATKPFEDAVVLQNEYFLWQQEDAHSKAYKTLLDPASKRIANNLGIKAAHKDSMCLVCHSDYVPEDLQAKRFSVSDGVSCEACHGGAERWLGPHVSGNTHQQNLDAGLYPTEDPEARAELCLSCHQGARDKEITHRIMGAGHPPLSFELDTFTAIQPAHYQIDADYMQRKTTVSGVRVWALGQVTAVRNMLDGIASERFTEGLFPELVFFDCDACHHRVDQSRWEHGIASGLGPGRVRLADAHAAMVGIALQTIDADLATRWAAALRQLHIASIRSHGAIKMAARTLQALNDEARDAIRAYSFSALSTRSILTGLIDFGRGVGGADYTKAEQITMALGALVAAAELAGDISQAESKRLNDALDGAFDLMKKRASYKPSRYRTTLKNVAAAMP